MSPLSTLCTRTRIHFVASGVTRNYRVVCIYQPRSCRYFESHRTNTLSKRLDLYLESNCDFNKIPRTDIALLYEISLCSAMRYNAYCIYSWEREREREREGGRERGDATSFEIIYYLFLSLSSGNIIYNDPRCTFSYKALLCVSYILYLCFNYLVKDVEFYEAPMNVFL